ncbi:MAG TPA: tetratricopeptide repeat protein [Burkholderiaceae bacterium]|nr:tetratricopeptide repeat protein [Burkholderiaceae bacterium]
MSRRKTKTAVERGALQRRAVASALALALLSLAAADATVAQAGAPAAATDFRSALAAARAATERRDWADALPRWQALEAAAPRDVDLLIESARVHGFADRNAESAQRYRKAIELAPARRSDVLLSLAWQTLWSGDPAGAEVLFQEVAAQPAAFAGGGDGFDAWRGIAEARRNAGQLEGSIEALERAQRLRPSDPGTARTMAQTLAWLDRYDEAIAVYTRLIERDPTDRASTYGLIRTLNDAGRHREAVAHYQSAFAADRAAGRTPPQDARFDYARALRWAGYDDLAHPALQGLSNPDARWLHDFRAGREQRNWADAGVEFATDSDELDTRLVTGVFGWRFTPSSSLELGVRLVDLTEPTRDASGERLGLTLRTRFGAAPEAIGSPTDHGPLWTTLSVQANKYDDWQSSEDWQPVTGFARARWLPTDVLRVDGEVGREVVETPLAISNRVTVNIAALGADWRWQPRSSVAAGVSALDFSDGNLRMRMNLRADHRVWNRPRVILGVEAMAFRSSDPTSDTHPYTGYWNPRDYQEARVYAAVGHEARPWDFTMKLGVGTSREEDAWGNRSTGKPNVLELAAVYDLDKSVQLRAYAGGSGGSMGVTSGGEGYWRRYAGIAITGWF